MKNNKQCRIFRLCSFLLPVIILSAYFILKHIAPFGNSTFLIHDMNAQYVDYYAYLRTVLQGKNNFLYSFSRGLGGDFPSFFSYYLISPFNLIPVLFPDELMPVGISIEMMLLFGLAGLACYSSLEYFSKTNQSKNTSLFLLFLSLTYSFSGWMLLNAENFQFTTEAPVVPMVIMYCQKARKGERLLPAILWCSLAVVLNFYLGYMILIFAFLWLFVPEKAKFSKRLILIFLFTVLISSPILFFVVRQLGMTIKQTDPQWYLPIFNFSLPDLLRKFLPGQFDHSQYQDKGLPAVFCTLTTCAAAGWFFYSCKDSEVKRHRLSILCILIVSLFFRPLTMVWQGFSEPHWWPYRFSFLLIYLIVICAGESGFPIRWYMLPLGVVSLVFNMVVTFTVKMENAQQWETYSEAVVRKTNILTQLHSGNELFRIEDLTPRTDNDAMHFGYSGITDFDSLANRDVYTFLKKLGFPQERYTLQYGLGNTLFANEFLGVRHVISENNVIDNIEESSLAYLLLSEEISEMAEPDNPMDFQNALAHQLGFTEPFLVQIEPGIYELKNLECNEQFCWKVDPEEKSAFVYRVSADPDKFLYAHVENEFLIGDLYYAAESGQKTSLSVLDYFIPLREGGDESIVEINIIVDSVMADIPVLSFYSENSKEVSEMFQRLSDGIFVEKLSSSELLIHLPRSSEERKLFISVPYDKQWKAEADGIMLDISEVWDTFMLLTVPADITEISLSYHI